MENGYMDKFIYGKDSTEGVVSVDRISDGTAVVFYRDGNIKLKRMSDEYWILYHLPQPDSVPLKGDLHYKWAVKYPSKKEYEWGKIQAKRQKVDHFVVYNAEEMFMVRSGVTYYKGMTPSDVKVLSFDIETTGLVHNKDSKVLLITTSTQYQGEVVNKLWSYDEFDSPQAMIYDWCAYVRQENPDVILGHNIFGFDFPYLKYCHGGELRLGRDQSPARFSKYPSKFRKDGSQSYDYNNITIYGREVIDTFHLSIKYDIGRKYPSYGLKAIIETEGLEDADRQHYDAARIKDNYKIEAEWLKIKEYAKDDAQDAIKLWNLMIPAFFYYAQSIPKTMQQIINSATGSQVNSFLLRSYLSEGHSIPKASDTYHYQGGISFGNPGIHNNVFKVDVASLYPSIMLQHRIESKDKDPKGYMLKMVETFTRERLKNKQLAKETGERYYKDLESAQKIVINSAYGFMGAPGLNFNYPKGADEVTKWGRETLQDAIEWAESKGYSIVNADTDSISYSGSQDIERDLEELNLGCPDMIRWEDDGQYKRVIVVKAKNYVLQDMSDWVTIKGSGLKATMKEPALRNFIKDVIGDLLNGNGRNINELYFSRVRDIVSITDKSIAQWCSKKTITKAVLGPTRTNEQRILDAIQRSGKKVSEGDKIFVFFKTKTELSLLESFNGEYCQKTLLGKLYKTIKIFESVVDISELPNLTLKRNQDILERVIDEAEARWKMGIKLNGPKSDREHLSKDVG